MRLKFLKSILPVFTLVLAVFSAFAFKSADEKLLAPESGWINLPGLPCAIITQCDNTPGSVCTAVYQGSVYQAFGKEFPTAMFCNKILYRPL
ncbi:MAG: DUF6520 family protein [Flavobacterium sp.]